MSKKTALSVSLLFFLFTLLAACSTQNSENNSVNKEDSAPSFELNDLDGNVIALDKYAGEKVYIKYWASWCPACLDGLEDVDELSNKNTDFHVFTIVNPSYNGEMESADFKEWFQSLDFDNMTVLLDEKGVWAKEFHLAAYPTSYFIDSDGSLVKTVLGNQSNTDIINEFKEIF